MLKFPDGRSFAVGSANYEYRPAGRWKKNSRIFCWIEIAGQKIEAALDTGGIYFSCAPDLAEELASCITIDEYEKINIRGEEVPGGVGRHDLIFLADEGEDLIIDAYVFLPSEDEFWPEGVQAFLGLGGCLEYLRFAIDPFDKKFYFGRY